MEAAFKSAWNPHLDHTAVERTRRRWFRRVVLEIRSAPLAGLAGYSETNSFHLDPDPFHPVYRARDRDCTLQARLTPAVKRPRFQLRLPLCIALPLSFKKEALSIVLILACFSVALFASDAHSS